MKTTHTLFFLSFAMVLFFTSCKDNAIDKTIDSNYKSYTWQQQGWKSKRSNQFINDINYTATEVPLQYYLLKSLGDNHSKIDSIYKEHDDERIIEVEFQHIDQTDLLEKKYSNRAYEEATKYMAFKIEKDFKIVTSSNDTIACSGANFERNFKVAPFKRIILHFNGIDSNDGIQLLYEDRLFGNGIIKFRLDGTPLKL